MAIVAVLMIDVIHFGVSIDWSSEALSKIKKMLYRCLNWCKTVHLSLVYSTL